MLGDNRRHLTLPLLFFHDHNAISSWNQISERLNNSLSGSSWNSWIQVIRPVSLQNGVLLLAVPENAKAWIDERLKPSIQQAAQATIGPQTRVHICSDQDSEQLRSSDSSKTPTKEIESELDSPNLLERYRFEEFVLGPSNQFAHGAALAISENPGLTYNPMFICGPPGVGKTHLLQAIGNYVVRNQPGMRVAYLTAETFTNEFTSSLRSRGVHKFKSRYRKLDLLLVDDVQFLIDKTATMEEFFHTFNALHSAGAQIVLTADRVPDDLDKLETRLKDRFASGLVAEIEKPDIGTRMAVLRKRLSSHQISVNEAEVVDEIAQSVTSSMRAVEAALVRVIAFSSLTGEPITRQLTQKVLSTLVAKSSKVPGTKAQKFELKKSESQQIGIEQIIEITAGSFGISREEMLAKNSNRRVSWARKVAMYMARKETSASFPEIGTAFGNRNHSTVMSAINSVEEKIRVEQAAQIEVSKVRSLLINKNETPQNDR